MLVSIRLKENNKKLSKEKKIRKKQISKRKRILRGGKRKLKKLK